jgi:hypothetical protein
VGTTLAALRSFDVLVSDADAPDIVRGAVIVAEKASAATIEGRLRMWVM